MNKIKERWNKEMMLTMNENLILARKQRQFTTLNDIPFIYKLAAIYGMPFNRRVDNKHIYFINRTETKSKYVIKIQLVPEHLFSFEHHVEWYLLVFDRCGVYEVNLSQTKNK